MVEMSSSCRDEARRVFAEPGLVDRLGEDLLMETLLGVRPHLAGAVHEEVGHSGPYEPGERAEVDGLTRCTGSGRPDGLERICTPTASVRGCPLRDGRTRAPVYRSGAVSVVDGGSLIGEMGIEPAHLPDGRDPKRKR
jgi:hypothetical protein